MSDKEKTPKLPPPPPPPPPLLIREGKEYLKPPQPQIIKK